MSKRCKQIPQTVFGEIGKNEATVGRRDPYEEACAQEQDIGRRL
ncbi:MAG: hypothetical protein ACHQIK_18260 [Candidatus Acidiferrales bacterium]